jgi:hypothetical protein
MLCIYVERQTSQDVGLSCVKAYQQGEKGMTTADWFEWGAQAMSNLAQFFAIFLTLTSAYLVMAFVAGKDLSRGQLVLINTFYVLCICFNIFSQMTTLRNALFAFNRATNSVEGLEGVSDSLVSVLPVCTAIICAAITLGCLKFMWDIRHPKTE